MKYYEFKNGKLYLDIKKLNGREFGIRDELFNKAWNEAVITTPRGKAEVSRNYLCDKKNIIRKILKPSIIGARDFYLYMYDFNKIFKQEENKKQLSLF